MSDGFKSTVNSSGLIAGFRELPDTTLRYTKPACHVTAGNIQREARARVKRATGETANGIQVFEMHNGTGYVVASLNRRMPNLPLWIEAGTKKGKPGSHSQPASPFFYPAVRLEEGAHGQRISEAVQAGIAAEGFRG